MLNKLYIRISFIFFFVYCFSGTSLSAQEYLVKSFGAKQGLASPEIYTLFQDADGIIWLGTKFGLSRFDGVHFTNYNGSDSLRFGKVYAIAQDAGATIWVGAENGLFYLNEGLFQQVNFDKQFPDHWIYSLNTTNGHALWVGTSSGPVFLNAHMMDALKSGANLPFKILKDWDLFSDPGNQVWKIYYLNSKEGERVFFGTRNNVVEYHSNKLVQHWFSKEPKLEDVTGIQLNEKNELLIGTRSGFFYKENNNQFDTIHRFTYTIGIIPVAKNESYVLGFEGVYSIIGNNTKQIAEIATLGYDSPSSILLDKEGNLWIGTWEGLVQLRKNTIQTWLPGKTENLNDLFSVEQSPSGEMVFGGNRGNVITFKDDNFLPYFPNNQKPWPISEVFGMYFTNNHVWMGSGYQGISIWNGSKMINYVDDALKDNHSHGFFYDDKQNFYALTEGGFTQILNEKNPEAAIFKYIPWPVDIGGRFLKIFDYAVLENNAIYLATNFGVIYFDGETLLNVKTDNALLNDAIVTSFTTTDKQSIWLSTGNFGIFKIIPNGSTAKIVYQSNEQDGLLADAVLDIVYDEINKYIWCAHYNGLTVLDLAQKLPQIIKRLTKDEGFLGIDFTYCKLATDKTGEHLWLATTAGLQRLSIKEMPVNKVPPTPLITKILLFNDADAVGAFSKSQNKVSGLWLNPKFPHNKNAISFHFQSLSLVIPELNRCRYKLIGYNEEWTYAANIGEVTFAALSPGDYTFVLEAANNDGLWNPASTSYTFSISKPFWATWWFLIGSVVLAVALSYAIYRYRLNQLIKIGNIRNKIAGDLHDDVGSTLSSISMYSEIVRNQIKDKSDINDELLKKITRNSKEMVENMSDIVWAIKPENDAFKNIENRMFNFATEMCNLKGVTLNMDKARIDGDLKIKMEQRRDFYLLFKEAVNNAIKYADCTTLTVQFKVEQKQLLLSVADDGKGFDIEQIKKQGNGLQNMQYRASMHGGECKIESAPGKGTVVTVVWPLT
jgi:signal transduction histidine kinase/ligand-binding sensor domain-containing protein